MQIQLTAYVVRLVFAYESETDFLEVLMAIWAFMVLIVLTLLKRLKIWTPVVKESALDNRAVFALRTVGDFNVAGLLFKYGPDTLSAHRGTILCTPLCLGFAVVLVLH